MRILVVYGSALGATRGIAERVAATIGSDGHDVDVRSAAESPPVEGYDALVIGSAVHGGHWLPEAAAFVRTNRERLADRPTWLFSSGPVGDQYVTREGPDPAEIEDFRSWLTPRDHRVFAGAHDRSSTLADRLGTVNRFVARRLIPEGDWRDWPAIEAWATRVARELAAGARPLVTSAR